MNRFNNNSKPKNREYGRDQWRASNQFPSTQVVLGVMTFVAVISIGAGLAWNYFRSKKNS